MSPRNAEQLLRRTLREHAEQAMTGVDIRPALQQSLGVANPPRTSRQRKRHASGRLAWIAGSLLAVVFLIGISNAPRFPAASTPLRPVSVASATPHSLGIPSPVPTTRPAGTAMGQVLPSITVQGLDGRPIVLDRYRPGQPRWIAFWAPWCSPCRNQIPTMQLLAQKYASQGLALLSIDIDERKTADGGDPTQAAFQDFARQNPVSWPLAIDQDSKITAHYRLEGIPLYLFVAPDGVIKQRLVGAQDAIRLEVAIHLLLTAPVP